MGLPERWNWWLGALDIAHGGHAEFRAGNGNGR
jgi:hypothetical protein